MQKDDLLENVGASRDTEKTSLINYVISKKKEKNLWEETRFTRIRWNLVTSSTIVTSEEACELQIY